MNTLVAKWRFTATSPKLGDRLFSAFSSPGRVVYRNVAFFLMHLPITSYWTGSGRSLFMFWASNGKKGEKLSNLTIFDHQSILMHLPITWPSCNVSGRIDFIVCLLVGLWHPHLMSKTFWHCLLYSQSDDSRRQAPNFEIGYFQLSAALGELFRETWLFF